MVLAFAHLDPAGGAVHPSLIFQLLGAVDAGQVTIGAARQSRGEQKAASVNESSTILPKVYFSTFFMSH